MHTRGAGNQHHALPGSDDDLFERLVPCDHVRQVVLGLAAERDLRIGQSEIPVQQHDALAHHAQRDSQIGRQRGLADAALAAGNADDFRAAFYGFSLHVLPSRCG